MISALDAYPNTPKKKRLRDQRDKFPKRSEMITAWTLGRRESRNGWLAGTGETPFIAGKTSC
jgi:hypothetical protein